MKKMLVTSFYNTLIDEEDAIPTSTMLVLDQVKQKGYFYTILTNRGVEDVLYYNDSYPFIQYIIALNGSILYDVNHKKILYKKKIDKEKVEEIWSKYSDYKMIFYTENNFYFEIPKEDVLKIEVILPKKIKSHTYEDFGLNYSIFQYNQEIILEFSPTTSFSTFERLIKGLEISKGNVFSIIGNDSEKDFINEIDECYIVSNASKELKKLTRKRTKSSNLKGVENLLKKQLKKL